MTVRGAELISWGYNSVVTVKGLLAERPELHRFVRAASDTADPDQCLAQLGRLAEEGWDLGEEEETLGAGMWDRLLALLGGSRALGDFLIANTEKTEPLLTEVPTNLRTQMVAAVGGDPLEERPVADLPTGGADTGTQSGDLAGAVSQMRRKYHQILAAVAAEDLAGTTPILAVGMVGSQLALLADAALETALAIARAQYDAAAEVDLSIIALGKTGAQELNYVSDVDVMFLVGEETTPEQLGLATEMARAVTSYCSAPGLVPPLWTLDANLRPEGKNGPLVRTSSSAVEYYQRWAQNWEFQALLKARGAAGDAATAEEFLHSVDPLVWSVASEPDFVRGMRKMRQKIEGSVPISERDRELKLSAGGLRDVEFTVQLLQLVHGQTDLTVRKANTLAGIDSLAAGGYISRAHAHEMADAYRFLRLTEHRTQLQSLRRTHSLPTSPGPQRALARSIEPGKFRDFRDFKKHLDRLRRRVHQLQQDVYYRPIVEATAGLGDHPFELNSEGAVERLRTIGYSDPEGALRSLVALTSGTSRRALIQRNLAPVMVEWLSAGADPDMGMLSFRTLSEQNGDSHWYLSLLRDSSTAAYELSHALANSKWAEGALAALPEAVTWLDDDALLEPPDLATLRGEAQALLGRHDDPSRALGRISSLLSREVTRAGLSDLAGTVNAWRPELAGTVDIVVEAALTLALQENEAEEGQRTVSMVAAGLGSYGGLESTFASDVDLVFVHEAAPGIDAVTAARNAAKVVVRVQQLLSSCRQETIKSVDLDLRPEGRNGALSRTVESYRDYYQRWSSPWEKHALIRLRVVAGDNTLASKFLALVDEQRWQWKLTGADLREVRLLKARMENERLPRGIQRERHVKLGPGGLADVEWTTQLVQLQHAGEYPQLRTPSTLPAIEALIETQVLSAEAGEALRQSWLLASRIRSANVLATGRTLPEVTDVLPRKPKIAHRVANLLGFGVEGEDELVNSWLAAARKSRAVMEQYFWN